MFEEIILSAYFIKSHNLSVSTVEKIIMNGCVMLGSIMYGTTEN